MKNNLNRRDLLRLGFEIVGVSALSSFGFVPQSSGQESDDHFFLQIFLPLGTDISYLFDARPLEMKAAGKMQNYLNKEPLVYTGVNGVSCLHTELVTPLKSYLDRFSILNGVIMSPAFDGHDQNTNMWFAGNPFGGESFIPHLNKLGFGALKKKPIDAFLSGIVEATITNSGETVPMSPDNAQQLINKLKERPLLESSSSLQKFIQSRLTVQMSQGQFSKASQAYSKSLSETNSLADLLKKVQIDGTQTVEQIKFVSFISELFKSKISKSAILNINSQIATTDCHDPAAAKKHPEVIADIVLKVTTVLKAMRETPFDSSRSILDVTTVVVASEFGRTLKQPGKGVDETGTDHNALNNSILVGGKGIKGGLVIGSSDIQVSSEELSGAHKSVDANGNKTMGRPFNFADGVSVAVSPEKFAIDNYLTVASVTNTLYSLFGVPESQYRKTQNNGNVAPKIKHILS